MESHSKNSIYINFASKIKFTFFYLLNYYKKGVSRDAKAAMINGNDS